MDDVDIAQEQEQMARDEALRQCRERNASLRPAGRCHYCEAGIESSELFCDVECRRDYERFARVHRKLFAL